MTPATLIAELLGRGVEPVIRDGRLRLRGPASCITPELIERVRQHRSELLAHLHTQAEEAEIDQLAAIDGWNSLPPADHPAYSIVATCHLYEVALGISERGDLVVGKPGATAEECTQPWRSLIIALEAHREAVARLVESGWTLRCEFPADHAA